MLAMLFFIWHFCGSMLTILKQLQRPAVTRTCSKPFNLQRTLKTVLEHLRLLQHALVMKGFHITMHSECILYTNNINTICRCRTEKDLTAEGCSATKKLISSFASLSTLPRN